MVGEGEVKFMRHVNTQTDEQGDFYFKYSRLQKKNLPP